MNKNRRERLERIASEMDELRSQLESLRDEEQDAFDNTPDSLRESDKGQETEAGLDTLNNAVDELESLADALRELC